MSDFRSLLKEYVRERYEQQRPTKLLPLMMPTFGEDEILEAFDSLVDMNVTMGKKVERFETDFSRYLGIKHSCMVNSGSSANLLALSLLTNPTLKDPIKHGDEVLVPAVTWSTTIYPILNIGARPVLVDVDEDYLIDIEKMKGMVNKRTKAVIPVHLLGNVCDMNAIKDLASDHHLYVVEDCCEALGSEYKGRKVGNFSDLSTFSFYFSHHITTVEGGMVCTNDLDYADLSRILRAHGYVRHSLKKDKHTGQHPHIDPRFLFVNIGFNFRPMEIQGAFGIHQLKKLEGFVERRIEVGRKLTKRLERFSSYIVLPREKKDTRHSWFVYPIMVKKDAPFTRDQLTAHLEKSGIETRPVVCGNFADQPAWKLFDHVKGDLSNAQNVMSHAFYIGVHPHIDDKTIDKVAGVFEDFFAKAKASKRTARK